MVRLFVMLSRRLLMLAAALGAGGVLASCSVGGNGTAVGPSGAAGSVAVPTPPQVTIAPADKASAVALDAPVTVASPDGALSAVSVTAPGGVAVAGALAPDAHTWTASDGLDPGVIYTVKATAASPQGTHTTAASSFSTITAVAGRLRTTASPDDGATVGVGETINLRFNTAIPQAEQAALSKRLVVTSVPPQPGAWHWFSASELHYRPENFWSSGTHVTLNANLHGVNAGNGYWGLASFSQAFTVGDKHLSVIDNTTHQMQVFVNDQLKYTWPVSLGKAGFPTIEGTMTVLTKVYVVKMSSCGTFGGAACSPGNANYYNENVYYDTAISTNGFFVHAAPWSVGQQGVVNVSHGCVNLSTERATTFYNMSVPGDVVQISHTGNIADYSNGEADWQIPFAQYDNTGNPAPINTPVPSGTAGGI